MFGLFGGKKAAKKSDFEIEDDHDEEQGKSMLPPVWGLIASRSNCVCLGSQQRVSSFARCK